MYRGFVILSCDYMDLYGGIIQGHFCGYVGHTDKAILENALNNQEWLPEEIIHQSKTEDFWIIGFDNGHYHNTIHHQNHEHVQEQLMELVDEILMANSLWRFTWEKFYWNVLRKFINFFNHKIRYPIERWLS